MLPVNYTPSDNDVLCGRGNVFSTHYGNQFFGKAIRANINEYKEASSRPDKIKVVGGILREIRNTGARFTKVDNETERWYELNDVQAHQKIGHAIRDTIRLLKKENNNNNNNNSSTTSTSTCTPAGPSKNKTIARRRTKSKSSVAKKKMLQQKRQSGTIQQQQQLIRSSFSSSLSSVMDDILKMSLDTIEFLDDTLGDYSVLKQQDNHHHHHHHRRRHVISPSASASASASPLASTFTLAEYINNKESFLLENEFPEQQFNFNPLNFFREENIGEMISNSSLSQ